MYQGLNETAGVTLRGARLSAPLSTRLYPLRRQSASPYTLQGEQLKEEDDGASSTGLSVSPVEPSSSRNSLVLPSCDSDMEAIKVGFSRFLLWASSRLVTL